MANYIKKEMETFEFDKRYYSPQEHRWCFLNDDENYKKYVDEKAKKLMPKRSRVQSDPEVTGQKGSMI